MARLTLILSLVTAVIALLGGFRFLVNEWRLWRVRRTLIPVLILSALSMPSIVSAASHYVLQGASGSANGSDWTNACTDFTGSCAVGSLVRGDTYYVGNGSYAATTFSTAASGTSVITILKATVAAHGTSTGWVDTMGNGVATFSCTVTFSTPYWVFDGVSGPLQSRTPSAYGFNMAQCASPFDTSSTSTNVTVSHVSALADAANVEKIFLTGRASNLSVTHNLLNGFQNCMMTRGPDFAQKDNWVFDYNVHLNQYSSTTNHAECLNANEANLGNLNARWNVFEGWSNDISTAVIVANNSNVTSALVCGNTFNDVSGANGIITGTSVGRMTNVRVINNSFYNFATGCNPSCFWLGASVPAGTGNIAINNVLRSMSLNSDSEWTTNYGLYSSTTGTPTGSNNISNSIDPFVNAAGGNFALSAATTAGQTQTDCLTDALGNTRGADGTWDRGAFEFVAGGVSPPSSSPTASVVARFVRFIELCLPITGIAWHFRRGIAAVTRAAIYAAYRLQVGMRLTVLVMAEPLAVKYVEWARKARV